METQQQQNIPDHVMKQTAEWFARSRAHDFSVADKDRLDAWLRADPIHRTAFDESLAVWNEVGRVAMPSFPAVRSERPKHRFFFRRPGLGLAGIGLMAVLLISVFVFKSELVDYRNLNFGKKTDYRISAGNTRKITLPDGSRLEMNGNSIVSVRLNPWQRNVTLAEGELFLKVQHDPQRPFEVRSHNTIIRVLGTSFHVRSRSGRVSVDVESGRVKVNHTSDEHTDTPVENRIITGGEGIDYKRTGGMNPIRLAKLEEVSAWRKGRIIFRSMPLADVLEELMRHHDTRLELADKEMEERRFTGTFDTYDLDEILEAIQLTFSLTGNETPGGTIVLRPRY